MDARLRDAPLKIMQIRLAGLSRIDPTHGLRAALEIEVDGTCWELDETGEPPAFGFARLLKREDPDVILSEWGDSTILLCGQQVERLRFVLNLNRDLGVAVQHQKHGATRAMDGYYSSEPITNDTRRNSMRNRRSFPGLSPLGGIGRLSFKGAGRDIPGV